MMEERKLVYRHSWATRVTHWLFFLAFLALVSSGLQIFNAAPFLDAADKTDPGHRVLQISAPHDGVGTTTLFGRTFTTTGWLGWTADGMGGESPRAFPAWITIPSYQDLADGRRWHLFFAWIMVICGAVYVVFGFSRGRKYKGMQKAAYIVVVFGLAPLIVVSGLALSPAFDAWMPWLPHILGGRQFARLWHFAAMLALIGFFAVHLLRVATTGVFNHLRSMVTGYYAT